MIVQFSYPILDLRRITNSSRADLVHAPNWFGIKQKDESDAYLKGMGSVVFRPSTGKLQLPMESLCTDVLSKLRFTHRNAKLLFGRIFWDSGFSLRLDLGFKIAQADPTQQIALLTELAKAQISFAGLTASIAELHKVLATPLEQSTTTAKGQSIAGLTVLPPTALVQIPFLQVRDSELLHTFLEWESKTPLEFAPEFDKPAPFTDTVSAVRLLTQGELILEEKPKRKRLIVWVVPERKVIRKAALDPIAVARHMRIIVGKLNSERRVIEAAILEAATQKDLASRVLESVQISLDQIESRDYSRKNIIENDDAYGAALKKKAFIAERFFAANQYYKLEVFRQQTVANLRSQPAIIEKIEAGNDIHITIQTQRIELMANETPLFGTQNAGRDINTQVGDNNKIETGDSVQYELLSDETWAMLAAELPKLKQHILETDTTAEALSVATEVAKATSATETKDTQVLMDSLKAGGNKLVEFATGVGSATLLAWLKSKFGA
jgi:hypothetical protein